MAGPHLLPSEHMPRQLDLGEVALADRLQQPVLADVRLLISGDDGAPAKWHAGTPPHLGLCV